MKKFNIGIAALILTALIAGCSKSNVPPPTPLTETPPNKVQVNVVWTRSTGNGNDNLGNYNLAPTSKGNVVFVPNQNGMFYALDLTTGKVLWQKEVDGNISTQPNFKSNAVVFGTMKGRLIALDTITGHKLWTAIMPSSLLSRPTIFGKYVYTQTHDGSVSAFNIKTGLVVWDATNTTPEIILTDNSSPIVLNNTVMVGTSFGTVLGFTAEDGERTINIPIAIAHGSSPAEKMVDIAADPLLYKNFIVFASYQGAIVTLNKDNGHMVWAKKSSVVNNISINKNKIFTTQADSTIKAFNIETGATVWAQHLLNWRGLSSPIYYKGMIVVSDYEGYLHFFTAAKGRYLGRYKLTPSSSFFNEGVSRQLIATKKGILVEANNGKVYLVDAHADKIKYDNTLSDYKLDKGPKVSKITPYIQQVDLSSYNTESPPTAYQTQAKEMGLNITIPNQLI